MQRLTSEKAGRVKVIKLPEIKVIGGDTWYWRFLEFGTEHAAAKPILRPAMNGVDTDVINIFALELEKAIDRAVRSAAKKERPYDCSNILCLRGKPGSKGIIGYQPRQALSLRDAGRQYRLSLCRVAKHWWLS
ncbi:MAG: HK97-gp10 family putative phage morphogenesis protein [Enterobacteriaceae bacterium]